MEDGHKAERRWTTGDAENLLNRELMSDRKHRGEPAVSLATVLFLQL